MQILQRIEGRVTGQQKARITGTSPKRGITRKIRKIRKFFIFRKIRNPDP
jgi:hypothetical protein